MSHFSFLKVVSTPPLSSFLLLLYCVGLDRQEEEGSEQVPGLPEEEDTGDEVESERSGVR
jgi:hypothetical protein